MFSEFWVEVVLIVLFVVVGVYLLPKGELYVKIIAAVFLILALFLALNLVFHF